MFIEHLWSLRPQAKCWEHRGKEHIVPGLYSVTSKQGGRRETTMIPVELTGYVYNCILPKKDKHRSQYITLIRRAMGGSKVRG